MLQIIVITISGLIGTLVRQFPAFSLHDPGAYAEQVAEMHRRWDAMGLGGLSFGPLLVDVFDRLGFFRIFSAPWFVLCLSVLVISIVCCTLDRTPKLWRGVRLVKVEQPAAFFDIRLSERAVSEHGTAAPDDIARILRSKRFKVRRATAADGQEVAWVYGDRNQYFKLATLFTHLGLVLFLAGGAITAAFGFETVLFVGEGQTAPVAPVGTPHNLLVKNVNFEAPTRPDGSFEDFRTDLAVYRDGQQVARKTIRVNDPLTVDGFVFHQNTFGPSASVDIRDATGALVWTGPIILTEDPDTGFPSAFQTIPGSDLGVQLVLARTIDSVPVLGLIGVGAVDPDSGLSPLLFQVRLGLGASTAPAATAGYTITWTSAGAWTGMVVKNDPGQNVIWIAFASLITGLLLSFYFPRRRVWARFADGRIQLAMLADRYVDARREFGELLDAVGARTGDRPVQGGG
ncbi:MAG: cytochrome c biosis protein [Chloroflexota bacterium]|nr:cytochrome c biosis protein [Chloroflexota bacterium]